MTTQEPSRLRVRNWRDFQHYTDRNPPWIKLHVRLLSSRDWVMLDDASRTLAVASMLIASMDEASDGSFLADPDYVQRVAYLHAPPNFKPLIDIGFLEIASGCKHLQAEFRPETETETETEGRAGARVNSKKGAKMPDLPPWLPTDVWDEWVQHRREIGHTLKPTTIKAQFGKLERLRDQGHQPADVIRHSIEGGYQGLFAPKGEKPNGPTRSDGNPEHWT